jgi:hypothetical protein
MASLYSRTRCWITRPDPKCSFGYPCASERILCNRRSRRTPGTRTRTDPCVPRWQASLPSASPKPEAQLSVTQRRIDDMNLIHPVTNRVMCPTCLSAGGCDGPGISIHLCFKSLIVKIIGSSPVHPLLSTEYESILSKVGLKFQIQGYGKLYRLGWD